MNRYRKYALPLVAVLLAATVAYSGDPALSDPSQTPWIAPVHTSSSSQSATSTDPSATSTPLMATSTPVVNTPPTVQVMTFSGTPFPDDSVYKVNISGSMVSIRLRGLDDDGNLEYVAVIDEDDEEQGRADCDATMGSECTLEVPIPFPAGYERAFTYHGIAVDTEGATSEKSTRIEITSILDKDSNASSPSPSPPTPRSPRPPTPTPGPTTLPPTPVAGPTSIPTPEVVAYQTPTTLPEPKREPVPETERTPIRLESSPLPGKTSQSIPPGSNKGDVFTYKDGDRIVRVVLQNDLVVQKTAANTPDDIVIVKGAGDSIVRRQDKHGQDARPVFRAESGSGMMTLPGGVLLVLNAEWGQSEKERFFLDNNIAPDRISELGYLTNGFLIETDPGFTALEVANALADQQGVVLSSPNWWRDVEAK